MFSYLNLKYLKNIKLSAKSLMCVSLTFNSETSKYLFEFGIVHFYEVIFSFISPISDRVGKTFFLIVFLFDKFESFMIILFPQTLFLFPNIDIF